jgi:hypothetical protein
MAIAVQDLRSTNHMRGLTNRRMWSAAERRGTGERGPDAAIGGS